MEAVPPASSQSGPSAATRVRKHTLVPAMPRVPKLPAKEREDTSENATISSEAKRASETPRPVRIWWPTVAGLALGILAPGFWTGILDAWGQSGIRVLFPYVLLAGHTEVGISAELAANLTQLMVFLQFPLEGLVVSWGIGRGLPAGKAISQAVFVHALGIFVVFLLGQPLTQP